MLSKSQIKLIKSLSQKKFRNKHRLFIVEGIKGVQEFINSDFEILSIYVTDANLKVSEKYLTIIDEKDLKKISFLSTPQKALGVFKIPEDKDAEIKTLTVVLDGVRDPGNLGTIIRLCDWFGVENIICSKDTVDCYNPKVVQASMGSLTRVKVLYKDIREVLERNKEIPVFGAMLEGDNIYSEKLPEKAFILMGNEANGISEEMQEYISKPLTIPQFGKIKETESLNVATATSIILSEFRRNASIER